MLPFLTVLTPTSSLIEKRMTFLSPVIIISELHSETRRAFASSVVDIIFLNVLIPHTRDFVLCVGFRLHVFFVNGTSKYIKENPSVGAT